MDQLKMERLADRINDGVMVGNYLNTAGRSPAEDIKMVRSLGFTPVAQT